ncbi:glycosyltransferase [Dolichospermum circinale CS-534/05]|uniref:CgeB family protein n=1 Tax=Dolichospermum circinale TaxID=109265 RepID=UPI00232E99EF|nr:glycosyltransferase [Dolichospermum circinale]MDB9456400.1 glycosyltransferase [Dolichospermum circinale CS-541/06]MDB9462997.1 glycosyltransferase [Dolichospermum circinale CS-541/04]MDB9489686.1 glycosyltransferase [Dolichospermum circinale CS-534/05]MDB9549172.1 glycosyltransferase [Dolichospermum circinale CS-1031]
MKLLIIGLSGTTHIGGTFFKVAKNLHLDPRFINVDLAYQAPKWLKTINWHLRGRYPSNLNTFSQDVVKQCVNLQPQWLLTTGIAAINNLALHQIGEMGIKRLNFLTDDPFNPAHYAPWFFKALPHYDIVFSPRRANIEDLLNAGCPQVEYLPFGYDHDLFYPADLSKLNPDATVPDVVFAGGADRDRVPYMSALIKSGINLALYGGYWERYPETKAHTQGQADVSTLRLAIGRAKISLCLVRKANRDGNCMRTFEVPAIGSCMLTEDTQEHREIFGQEGEAVVYFNTIPEMLEKTHWLLNHDDERQRLAKNAHLLITQGSHTYGDRLKTMLSI